MVYILLAGWEVRIVKNSDEVIFTPEVFTMGTGPKPVNNMFIDFLSYLHCGNMAYNWVCLRNVIIVLAYFPSRNHSSEI